MVKQVKIFDTTLRDGEQSPGCSMNIEEKVEVAKQLERLQVDVMEAGFAIASPGDFKSIEEISKAVKNCTIASLARALEKDIDAAYNSLKHAESPRIHTFLATSPVHMKYKLRMTPEEVLERTAAMVAYAKKYLSNIEFSAEDATRSEREFLARVVETAINAGATVVNIPDTVGYTTPQEMYDLINYLRNTVPNIDKADISVHCHDDLGMAVANSLAAVKAGATQVEGTINGLGERAGNAALEEVVMAINTRKEFYNVTTGVETTEIYKTSRLIYNIIGATAPMNKAIVGANAFAHESGIHQHGVLAEKTTYEIMTPESVGLKTNNMVLGKHSGRHAFEDRLKDLGYEFEREELNKYFERFKKLCDKKKTVTDHDLLAIVTDSLVNKGGVYVLERFEVNSGNKKSASCIVALKDDEDNVVEEVAMGDGPIDAAYNAIDKIVKVSGHKLENYSIHSVGDGRDALGEVVVRVKYGDKVFVGRGLSTDILESSLLAYINGINKIMEVG
ncbi:MAG: 2-isopropylmalate synthase [Bacillota bacterium]|nr:2-isopropylmalate synthase [Bacillota bacterium]HHU61499.1 2-isopropylmalate synthase [Natronincola sp.]